MFKRLRTHEINQADYVVGVAIGRHVEKNTGETKVGLVRLAEETGLSVRTVQASVHRLEALGHLRIRRGKPSAFIPIVHLSSDGS